MQHLSLEAAVETAWQAWARFRGASGWWRPVTGGGGITAPAAEGHLSSLSHKKCLIPCGSDTLSMLHQRHVLIRKSAGCCDLDICSGATWEGFWRCASPQRARCTLHTRRTLTPPTPTPPALPARQ